MTPSKDGSKVLIAQTAEEVLNDESYHLYVHLIACITAYQLGKGEGPTDDEFAMWRAVQSKRIATTVAPLDTFFHRPDRRPRD
ncbi:MAG: hypothetical protein JWP29_1482 [Rhodoferax sp.]|nr:hypothetical protein [Rhodoferax sp.]